MMRRIKIQIRRRRRGGGGYMGEILLPLLAATR